MKIPKFFNLEEASHPKIKTVTGGASRSESVLQGLRSYSDTSDTWALVHDAARPCIKQTDVDKLFTALDTTYVQEHGALLALPSFNTLKQTSSHRDVLSSEATIDRSSVWQALTPQVFPISSLLSVLSAAMSGPETIETITDEASAYEWQGLMPRLLQGRSDNLKITQHLISKHTKI